MTSEQKIKLAELMGGEPPQRVSGASSIRCAPRQPVRARHGGHPGAALPKADGS